MLPSAGSQGDAIPGSAGSGCGWHPGFGCVAGISASVVSLPSPLLFLSNLPPPPLMSTLVTYLGPAWRIQHNLLISKSLIISAKFLLPYQITWADSRDLDLDAFRGHYQPAAWGFVLLSLIADFIQQICHPICNHLDIS